MNHIFIQSLRSKLETRLNRLQSIKDAVEFHFAVSQFWKYLHEQPFFNGILLELEKRYPDMGSRLHAMITNQNRVDFNREEEQAAASCILLGICNGAESKTIEQFIGKIYAGSSDTHQNLGAFRSMFIVSLCEYLDEHIDDQRIILTLLTRYKRKCEWYHQDRLYKLWEENSKVGENLLMDDMFEYLYDQGLNFIEQPRSVSGKADFAAARDTPEPFIGEGKIFYPEKGKDGKYIASGFNQIYIYTQNHNEPFGYLIIFKACAQDLKLDLALQGESTPYVIHNNKTIFIITIDIFPHKKTASKQGPLRPYLLREKDLIDTLAQVSTTINQ